MRNTFRRSTTVAVACGALLSCLVGFTASGSTIFTKSLPFPAPSGTDFKFSYNGSISASDRLEPGDFVVIYDFANFVPGTNAQPADWIFSTSNVGPVPSGTGVPDLSTLPNLTWTYNGVTIDGVTGGLPLGTFSADSNSGTAMNRFFAGSFHLTNGLPAANATTLSVPAPVPEPATLSLLALAGTAGMLRRRRR